MSPLFNQASQDKLEGTKTRMGWANNHQTRHPHQPHRDTPHPKRKTNYLFSEQVSAWRRSCPEALAKHAAYSITLALLWSISVDGTRALEWFNYAHASGLLVVWMCSTHELFYELLHGLFHGLLQALDWYFADILGIILSGIVASILTGTFTSH